jgi:hypothetical protein
MSDLWMNEFFPVILPPSWKFGVFGHPDWGRWYQDGETGMKIIVSGTDYPDGTHWVHLSISRPDRLPDWEDMKFLKNRFLGPDRMAIQIFPVEKDYVNIHPNCLHLWHRIEPLPIPEFAAEAKKEFGFKSI